MTYRLTKESKDLPEFQVLNPETLIEGTEGFIASWVSLKTLFTTTQIFKLLKISFFFQVQNMTDESQFESLYVYNATILEVANSSRLYSIDI